METTLRYCLICETTTRHDADGQCRPCGRWERLHRLLSRREYVLANTNDGTEYETPVLDAEYPR